MKRAIAYIKSLVQDLLFVRICLFLWGCPFTGIGLYAVQNANPTKGVDWLLLALFLLISAGGLYLLAVAAFGSMESISRAAEFTADGGDILGVLFVAVVVLLALPITALLRATLPKS